MLTQYAREHNFLVVEIYVDDGWSGLNFDHPDFNRMLDDIEAGKIDVVITKDLSRLGRDHLKVGHFRACLISPRARLDGGFSAQTSLKTLTIRQDCCGFLPRWTKNPLANPHALR